jgi:hypothetical protein
MIMSYFLLYALGLLLTLTTGFLFVRWLAAGRINPVLHFLLACVFGLGMAGFAAFFTHVLLNQPNHFYPVAMVVMAIVLLSLLLFVFPLTPYPLDQKPWPHDLKMSLWALPVLCLPAVPMIVSALHYPLGGWDAWSCWDLKAKFIFLGGDHWKDVLSPGLWRSNTH